MKGFPLFGAAHKNTKRLEWLWLSDSRKTHCLRGKFHVEFHLKTDVHPLQAVNFSLESSRGLRWESKPPKVLRDPLDYSLSISVKQLDYDLEISIAATTSTICIEIESEKSHCFSRNLLVVQNFLEIPSQTLRKSQEAAFILLTSVHCFAKHYRHYLSQIIKKITQGK